jgi:integrase
MIRCRRGGGGLGELEAQFTARGAIHNLALILPKQPKLSRSHHAALPYRDVPAFLATIRESQSIAAAALEFTILTAARTSEVLFATWDEIDIEARVWNIPASRMKAGTAHRVPLSGRAVEILESMIAIQQNDLIFAGLGDHAMRKLAEGTTVHGFRSSFADWVSEEANFSHETREAALAHAVGDKTEAAYRRGDALSKRRGLMEAWANYCVESRA